MNTMGIAQQLHEALGGDSSQSILEASLSRVWQHHGERGFAVISAWRNEFTRKEKDEATKELKKSVRGLGLGFVPLEGVGKEDLPGGKVRATSELGILIPRKKSVEAKVFRDQMLKLAKKFKQYSILVHDPDTGTDEVRPSGEVVAHFDKFVPGKGKFFSRLMRGDKREFKLEWWGVKHASPSQGWASGLGRHASGEEMVVERLEDWLEAVGRDHELTDWQLQVMGEVADAGHRFVPDDSERETVLEGLVRRGLAERTGRRGGTFGLTREGLQRHNLIGA